MKKFVAILVVLLFYAPITSWAALDNANSIISQSSPAAGEGSHTFVGHNLPAITVTWNAGTAARFLIIFDATGLPVNGATTSCTTNHVSGCYEYCTYLPNSGTAPSTQVVQPPFPWYGQFGIVAALSTGAGCGTLTVDTGADWFSGQAY